FERYRAETLREHPGLSGSRLLYEAIRRMLSAQVYDVIAATRAALLAVAPADVQAVREAPPLLQFSAGMRADSTALKRFLFTRLYRHPQVMQTTGQAKDIVTALFAHYCEAPQEMADSFAERSDRHR